MPETKGKRKLKVVEASGNHYEMGCRYGAACPEIARLLDITRELFGGRDKVDSLLKKFIPLYLPAAEKYAPEIVEEMRGMAEGAKVSFEEIFFLNITYEISVPSVMGGCTTFAATGEATANGEVIAGQNFDFIHPWEQFMVLLKMEPSSGPRIFAVTAAGCLGLIGCNSAGISVNLNLLKDRNSLTPTGGVPTHIILRKIFTSENIAEAITAAGAAEGRAAKNYLVTSAQGDFVDMETTTNDMDIQYPERGIYTHANAFKADRFKSADMAPVFSPDSYIRAPRLFQLMEKHRGKLSVDVMKKLLEDHNNHPGSICRHQNPKAPLPIAKMAKTLISIITLPKEQKAFISCGNPCENEYLEYKL
jgi:isopenicillin-N N-acyltransferase-like protein